MNRLLLILLILFTFSCQTKKSENERIATNDNADSLTAKDEKEEFNYENLFKLENFVTNHNPESSELTVLNEDCVIFTIPDSTQIAEMKGNTEEEEEGFYVAADDNNYYQYEASRFLDSLNVKCVYPKTRYLKFIMKDDSIIFDTKSKYSGGWMTILFKTDRKPKIVSSVGFEDYYNEFIKE